MVFPLWTRQIGKSLRRLEKGKFCKIWKSWSVGITEIDHESFGIFSFNSSKCDLEKIYYSSSEIWKAFLLLMKCWKYYVLSSPWIKSLTFQCNDPLIVLNPVHTQSFENLIGSLSTSSALKKTLEKVNILDWEVRRLPIQSWFDGYGFTFVKVNLL